MPLPLTDGYTREEFYNLKLKDRRDHLAARILRWVIGFQATVYLFRLPHAGWYVYTRAYRTQTITTTGPFKCKHDAQGHANSLRNGDFSGVSTTHFWNVPPENNHYMGFSYREGWRQKYLPPLSGDIWVPVIPPMRPVMEYALTAAVAIIAFLFGGPINLWTRQQFGFAAPYLVWAIVFIAGIAFWLRRTRPR